MSCNTRVLSALLLIQIAFLPTAVFAADVAGIEALMTRSEGAQKAPSSADAVVIDSFLADMVDELLSARDVAEAIEARSQIVKYRGWKPGLSLYTRSYVLTARRHIQKAFADIKAWPDGSHKADDLKTQATRNLTILIARMASIELRQLASGLLDHPDSTTRYWAVKSIAGPAIASQLNSAVTADADAAKAIAGMLQKRLGREKSPEIIGLIADFAARLKGPESTNLLIDVANQRIKSYEAWTVRYELMDAMLLKSLAKAIGDESSAQRKAMLSRAFCQLYSYVVQRYIMGWDILSLESKSYMVSVILEVESQSLSVLMGRKSDVFKKAVETAAGKGLSALQKEHDALLGGSGRTGTLVTRLNFKYNPSSNRTQNAPKKLKAPPAGIKKPLTAN